MFHWGDLFTARQILGLCTLTSVARASAPDGSPLLALLAFLVSRASDRNASLVGWDTNGEKVDHVFKRQALPMTWDFAEGSMFSGASGALGGIVEQILKTTESWSAVCAEAGHVQLADAMEHVLPDKASALWFTDPPYYDAVPYADLSDFFLVWLKRTMPKNHLLHDPFDHANPLTPKQREAVQDETKRDNGRPKDGAWFEAAMAKAFAEGRRVLRDDGVGSVVFAHKTTEGWEALLSGMIRGGWTITGSWPIATERPNRLRATDSAALATSVHLICRPRPEDAPIGDWGEVLGELPKRVGDWMERLQGENVRGADLVFACIGPSLEIFSRYSRVETAEGKEVTLAEYLVKVWEVVGRIALEQVLGTAEAQARKGAAGAVEEDARLTALFLWTLQSSNGDATWAKDEEPEDDMGDDEEDETTSKGRPKGYSLIFDVVRRFAQPLGIVLPNWEGRVIETKKGLVRLLPLAERAKILFGDAGAHAVADRIESDRESSPQLSLFPEMETDAVPRIRGRGRSRDAQQGAGVEDQALRTMREATTLDRVHAAMLLQSGGRTNALRSLLKAEQERGSDFLRLANALSALYPKGSEEKRLLDAMLLAVPR